MKKKYQFIYIAFAIFLAFQFAVAKKIAEPYPGIIFPSFATVSKDRSIFRMAEKSVRGITTSNDTIEVDKLALFHPIPHGYHGYSITKILENEEARTAKSSKQKEQAREKVKEFFQRNLAAAYPGNDFKALLFFEGLRELDSVQKDEFKTISGTSVLIEL